MCRRQAGSAGLADSWMGHENVVDVERMMSLNICGGVLDAIFGASVLGWVRREAGRGRAYDMFASWDPPTRRDGVGVDAAVGGSLFGSVVLLVLLRVKHRTNSPTLLSTPPSSRPSSRTSYTLPGDSPSTAFRPPSSPTLSPNLTFFTYTP